MKTSISKVEPNKILVRGYDLTQLVGRYSHADLTYPLWRGELPPPSQSLMMNALLTVCLEHSLNSPSVDAPIFVASSGVPLQAAVSAGVAAMGDWHGGAIEEAAKMLQEATAVQYKSIQELPGFYVYGKIPVEGFLASDTLLTRVIRVRNDCWNSLMKQNYLVRMSRWRLRFELTEKFYGKHLILNVDGCIAAIISDMGFDWRLGKDSS